MRHNTIDHDTHTAGQPTSLCRTQQASGPKRVGGAAYSNGASGPRMPRVPVRTSLLNSPSSLEVALAGSAYSIRFPFAP